LPVVTAIAAAILLLLQVALMFGIIFAVLWRNRPKKIADPAPDF
jgi:hypothetical protein